MTVTKGDHIYIHTCTKYLYISKSNVTFLFKQEHVYNVCAKLVMSKNQPKALSD